MIDDSKGFWGNIRLRAVSILLLNLKKAARSTRAESGEAAIVIHSENFAVDQDRGFPALPLITASPLSALVDRTAFFGFNSKIETARSLRKYNLTLFFDIFFLIMKRSINM